jgi:NAD(P)-dependent dehydrogenase (short-subunit alcohol dehydrogenase family)
MIGARNVLRRVSTTQAQSFSARENENRGALFGMISFDFNDRVVIITGAARGIGRAMVDRFVAAGAAVVAADRDAAGLADTCESHGESVVSIVADISTVAGAQAIVDMALHRWHRVDVCVNNAAVAPHAALVDERVDVWDMVYAVNCRGTFLMTQAAARAMIAAGRGGRIINFSSAASQRGGPGAASYASSRAAVEAFSRVAAIELAPYDILVNTVSPGLIDTQPQPLPTTMAARLGQRIPTLPLARPGVPDEVASVVLFLASEASTYISGSVVHVDGGASIGTRFNAPVVDDDYRYSWVTGKT